MLRHHDKLHLQSVTSLRVESQVQSPIRSNKENTTLKVRTVCVKKQGSKLSCRSDTDPGDTQLINDISQKIMNEILNSPQDQLLIQQELESVNKAISENSSHMKSKIQTLFQDGSSFKRNEHQIKLLAQLDQSKDILDTLSKHKQSLEQTSHSKQNHQSQLDYDEKEICFLQESLDKQQNTAYDFFEFEFTKLKNEYDDVACQYDQFLMSKNELSQMYSQMLETKAILKEDLNGRLLQRAELVAEKEEQEEILEHLKQTDPQLFKISEEKCQTNQQIIEINDKLLLIEQELIEQTTRIDEYRSQINKQNQLQLLESQMVQLGVKLKTQKNRLISIQKSLNLPHPDTLHNDFLNRYGNDPQKIPYYMQTLRQTSLRQSNHKWSSANEYTTLLEQYITTQLQYKQFIPQVNEAKQQIQGEQPVLQDEICLCEYKTKLLKTQLNDVLDKKTTKLKEIQNCDNYFRKRVNEFSEQAFTQYLEQNDTQLQLIFMQYGEEQYNLMIDENKEQFQDLIYQQETQKLENLLRLIGSFTYLERVIRVNIEAVDEKILPDLKENLSKLEEIRGQIQSFEKLEEDYQCQMRRVEIEIHRLEQEFRIKIQQFQEQDEILQIRLRDNQLTRKQLQQSVDVSLQGVYMSKLFKQDRISKLN